MKKSTLFTILFACIATFAFATVRRVNNNFGNNNNANSATFYTTLAAAYSAASSNDTIIVEPSATNYDALILTKKLTIIGNGFAGLIPANTQLSGTGSLIPSIVFSAGSAGSYITGLTITSNVVNSGANGSIVIVADNILIQRCRLLSELVFSSTVNTSGTLIKECYFENSNSINSNTGTGQNNNIQIKNCIFRAGALSFGASDGNIVVENNTFNWASASVNFDFNNASVVFNNNILRNSFPGSTSTPNTNTANTTMNNNICIGSSFLPLGNGNQNAVLYGSVFTGTTPPSGTDDARLKVASVALGAGLGGNDIGAFNTFAGSSSYVLGGVPNFPSIYGLNVATISNTTINVTISTKANN
jgi:hypothetical protein